MILADWEDTIQSLPGILTVTFIFGGWIIVAIVSSLSKSWRRIHESEHAAALKQSMIERGMSADEIERVLRAGPAPMEEPDHDAATELAPKLAEHGVPGPAMEQILVAFRSADSKTRKSLSKTVGTMIENGAESEQILAVVRAMGRSTPTEQAKERRISDDASSFRN